MKYCIPDESHHRAGESAWYDDYPVPARVTVTAVLEEGVGWKLSGRVLIRFEQDSDDLKEGDMATASADAVVPTSHLSINEKGSMTVNTVYAWIK